MPAGRGAQATHQAWQGKRSVDQDDDGRISPIPGRLTLRAWSGRPPGPGIPLARNSRILAFVQQTIPGLRSRAWNPDPQRVLGLSRSAVLDCPPPACLFESELACGAAK